jgi:hypothetical protein
VNWSLTVAHEASMKTADGIQKLRQKVPLNIFILKQAYSAYTACVSSSLIHRKYRAKKGSKSFLRLFLRFHVFCQAFGSSRAGH